MRRLTTIVAALLLSAAAAFAQAPKGFTYQAVVRDAQNNIVANQTIKVAIAILQGDDIESAHVVYNEEHFAKTNANGLFTIVVGGNDDGNLHGASGYSLNSFLKYF